VSTYTKSLNTVTKHLDWTTESNAFYTSANITIHDLYSPAQRITVSESPECHRYRPTRTDGRTAAVNASYRRSYLDFRLSTLVWPSRIWDSLYRPLYWKKTLKSRPRFDPLAVTWRHPFIHFSDPLIWFTYSIHCRISAICRGLVCPYTRIAIQGRNLVKKNTDPQDPGPRFDPLRVTWRHPFIHFSDPRIGFTYWIHRRISANCRGLACPYTRIATQAGT